MSCSGPNATSQASLREPDSPPREQEVRFWNNKQEVKPPPLSPISCNSSLHHAHTTVRRSRTQAEKQAAEQRAADLPHLKKLSISVAKLSSKTKEVVSADPETPHSASSHLSGSFVSLTLGKMATLKQSLQEGAERVPSPARDDALDAAVAAQENPGKVQKQVIEIERKEGKEGGFLGKVFSRKPSPARLTIPSEPAAKLLTRKTSPPSPAGFRSNGLPPKRALSPQPFRGKTVEVLREGRSQSAFQPRGAGMSPRKTSNERESGRKFATSPQRDSTSRHTKEWVNALKPPGLPAAHESRKDSDAKALRDRRSHAVAMMQSAHSHREGAVLLQSPTVSSSEDDDMWDVQAEADRLSSDSAEGSESDHLKLDRSELLRRSASEQSHTSRADIQSAEFARLVQRQKSFEESAQRPRPVERRAGSVVDGRTETLFSRESHSFSMAQWKKEMGPGLGAHTMGHSGSFGTGKAAAGLSADALRNRQGDSPNNASFGFAFDNAQFSDRVLVLEISADVSHELDGNSIDVKHAPGQAPPVRKPIHVNSAIVAVKSKYFYNLLGENQQQAAVMRIRPEDEAPVLDMLRFMYSAELRASAPEELAQVLIVSDRYAVSSCFKHTFRLLSAITVDALSACLFLDLPRHLKDPGQIQNLVLMARSWLVVHFRDLEKTYRTPEFLNLSLMGVRTILESNVLQISSEVTAFNALVNWSRHHFPDSEAQRAKVVAKLAHLIRFPFMTTEALRQALDMPELNSDVGRGLIVEALFFKAEPFFKQSKLAETETAHSRYVPRSNDSRLGVTLAPMDESGRQASIFFELPRSQFQNLQPGGHITSKPFVLGGQTLSAVVAKKAGKNSATEGVLSLCIHNGVAAKSKDLSWPLANGSIDVPVKPWDGDGPKKIVGEYEFFTRFHTMDPFQSVARGKLAFKSGKEEQGQSTVKFPEDKNTMIFLRADLVIKT